MSKTRETHALDLIGQSFSRWYVLEKSAKIGKHGEIYWKCRCSCGVVRDVQASGLRDRRNKSCGCLSRERTTTHGMEGTPTYNTWAHMLTRCRNEKHKQYAGYGGRGITVCERWLAFENFLADMGEKPPGKSLDRYPDNDGNYEPANCRWSDQRGQTRNRRISPRVIFEGREWSLSDLCEAKNLNWRRVYERIRMGWPVGKALSTNKFSRWGIRPGTTAKKRVQ